MKQNVGWGVLGPGRIADQFADAFRVVEGAKLIACGSRSAERAEAFAQRHGIAKVYDSYAALLEDPDVDIVYIANPHVFHKTSASEAIEHGKAVLCEKPLTVTILSHRVPSSDPNR